MRYSVRPAKFPDVDRIAEVARITWSATYENIIPEAIQAKALAQWYSRESLSRTIGDPAAAFYVGVCSDDRVVGFANASHRRDSDAAELWRMYILPDHQGKGLGRRLFHACLDALRAMKPVTGMYVQVETENVIARRAYEAFGFVPIRDDLEFVLGHPCRMTEMRMAVHD